MNTTATQTDTSQALNTTEAALILKISALTLKKWRREGKGPRFSRLGRNTVRYMKQDVMAWVQSKADMTNATLEG